MFVQRRCDEFVCWAKVRKVSRSREDKSGCLRAAVWAGGNHTAGPRTPPCGQTGFEQVLEEVSGWQVSSRREVVGREKQNRKGGRDFGERTPWNEMVSERGGRAGSSREQFVRPLATNTGLCHPTETRSVTTVRLLVDRSLQDPAPICCLVFRGTGARHPSMTLDAGADPLGHNLLQSSDHSQEIGDTPSACVMNRWRPRGRKIE